MQSGELIVSNSGQAGIDLGGLPIRIMVNFSDIGDIIVPCNPHFNDTLSWEINKNILLIRWSVSGIREIKWNVWFHWHELNIIVGGR